MSILHFDIMDGHHDVKTSSKANNLFTGSRKNLSHLGMDYGYLARTTRDVKSLELLGKAEEQSDKEDEILTIYKEHKLLTELLKIEPDNRELELYMRRQYWKMIGLMRAWSIDMTIAENKNLSIIKETNLITQNN